jgi:hypothetical protein
MNNTRGRRPNIPTWEEAGNYALNYNLSREQIEEAINNAFFRTESQGNTFTLWTGSAGAQELNQAIQAEFRRVDPQPRADEGVAEGYVWYTYRAPIHEVERTWLEEADELLKPQLTLAELITITR